MTDLPAGPLPSTEHRWPDRDTGPWLITLSWHIHDGRPECAGLVVSSANPEPGVLTASVVRKIPVADWIAEDRANMTPRQAAVSGLRKSTVDRLRTVAEIYQQARRAGQPPTKSVAEHFGISHGGASNLVTRARAAGLLPPTSPGVSTG